MKVFKIVGVVVLSCLPVVAQSIEKTGVSIQNGTTWDKLYHANITGTKSKGVAGAAFSYGIAKAHIVHTFREAEAPIQTSNPRPVFKVVGAQDIAPRDIIIVKLEKKKDHREIEVGSVRTWTGANMGYPDKAVTKVTVQQVEGALLVTPAEDLEPGEYLLFPGVQGVVMPEAGFGGFDFGVK